MKHLVVYALLLGIVSSSVSINSAQSAVRIHLSFDTLFPETASKQLYDTMLQLWSDVTLLHDETVKDRQKQDIADMITGQLVRIGYLIEYMQTKNNTLNYGDIVYLRSIVSGLSDCFNSFFSQEHIKSLWCNINNGFEALSYACECD